MQVKDGDSTEAGLEFVRFCLEAGNKMESSRGDETGGNGTGGNGCTPSF
jgi:hypothetical protein